MKLKVPHRAILDIAVPADNDVEYFLYQRYRERRIFAGNFISNREEAATEMHDALFASLAEDVKFLQAIDAFTEERKAALMKEGKRVENLEHMRLDAWNAKMDEKTWPLLKYLQEVPTEPKRAGPGLLPLSRAKVIKASPAMRKLLRK